MDSLSWNKQALAIEASAEKNNEIYFPLNL